jgi:hypothetical protein
VTTYYADSSALVKRYVNEIGSNWVQTLCDPATRHVLALAHIGRVEVAAALGIKERQGILPTKIRDALIHDLEQDARHQYWLIDQQFPMWEFTEKSVIVKSNSTGKGLTDGPKKFVIGRQFV